MRHRHRSPVSLLQQLRRSLARASEAELRLRGSAGRDRLRKLVQVQRLQLGEGPGHVLTPRVTGCQTSEASAKPDVTAARHQVGWNILPHMNSSKQQARCAHQQRYKGLAA